MRPLPTATYPDKTEGVTLKCPKTQEAVRRLLLSLGLGFEFILNGQACYLSPTGRVRAYNYLHTLCIALPVHIIYGGINDYLSA